MAKPKCKCGKYAAELPRSRPTYCRKCWDERNRIGLQKQTAALNKFFFGEKL